MEGVDSPWRRLANKNIDRGGVSEQLAEESPGETEMTTERGKRRS